MNSKLAGMIFTVVLGTSIGASFYLGYCKQTVFFVEIARALLYAVNRGVSPLPIFTMEAPSF